MTNANDTPSVAATYAQRGWAVIPIRAGAKMPIERDWPNQGRRTATEVRAAWELYPDANVGIVTGRVSGLWVLDVDPQNGGMAALAGLVAAYGKLPETYVVRTPSGGLHYYFLLPEDFEPRNAQHGRVAGRLPVGIDVRGRGGQVVAPPSVRPDGAYVLINDFPLSPAPEWLLDMIRPVEPPERVAAPTVLDELRVGRFWDGWIRKVFTDELQRLAAAPEGTRDQVCMEVARRLVEICNSSWNDLDVDDVFPHFMRAAQIASDNGARPFTAGEEKWRNAIRHKAGQGVPPPAPLGITGSVMPTDFDRAGQDPANPFTSPGVIQASVDVDGKLINEPPEQGEVVDQLRRARYIESQADKIRCDRAARRIVDDEERSPIDWSAEILNEDQLDELPEVRPLIEGVLDSDAFFRIVGKSGSKKSFVAIDMAVCVSAGIPWHGRAVQRGPVLYVLGEGAAGIKKRLQGAREHYGLTRHGVRIVRRPVQFSGVEWDSFVAHLAGLPEGDRPALIFLDTQAQMSTGLDENFAKDQSVIVGACRALRTTTGACVVLIHHVGLGDSKRGRGITTIFDALDNEILVTSKGMVVELEFMKTKEEERAEPLTLNAKRVDVGPPVLVSHPGTPLRSVNQPTTLVLVGGDDMDSMPKPNTRELSSARRLMLITVLREHFGVGSGGTKAEVRGPFLDLPEIKELSRDAARKAFDSAWSHLEHLGRLARNPGRDRFRFAEFDDLFDLEENVERVAPEGWDGWTIPDVAPEGRPMKADSE